VTPVLTQMLRDGVRAGRLGQQCSLYRTRIARAANLTQSRNVIDVDAEMDHATVAIWFQICWRSRNNWRVWMVWPFR